MENTTRLLIGLGSGRCGTKSLADLLNRQTRSYITHEGRWAEVRLTNPIPWYQRDAAAIAKHVKDMVGRDRPVAGDVAFYYLPHVEVICHLHPNVRFICLQRPRDATIKSLLAKVHKMNINPYQDHDGEVWDQSPGYSPYFPKYNKIRGIEGAVAQYYDDYYAEASRLEALMPEKFHVFPICALNDGHGVRGILDFCGFVRNEQKIVHAWMNRLKDP